MSVGIHGANREIGEWQEQRGKQGSPPNGISRSGAQNAARDQQQAESESSRQNSGGDCAVYQRRKKRICHLSSSIRLRRRAISLELIFRSSRRLSSRRSVEPWKNRRTRWRTAFSR